MQAKVVAVRHDTDRRLREMASGGAALQSMHDAKRMLEREPAPVK